MVKKSFYIAIIVLFVSCNMDKIEFEQSNEIVIAGRILDFDTNNSGFMIAVNRLGLDQLEVPTLVDSLGYFITTFESEIPTDVWIAYNTNFLVLTHPGDSINVEFDGKAMTRPELLKTVKFGGDATKTNSDAAVFQQMYFSNDLYTDREAQTQAIKIYDTLEYSAYLDTLQQKRNDLFEAFLSNVSPTNETKIWAQTYLDEDYYGALANYLRQYQPSNGLSEAESSVQSDYRDAFLKRLPLTEKQFISSYAISSFINKFHFYYLYPKILNDETREKYKNKQGRFSIQKETMDSLFVHGTIEHTQDTLLRQMVLAELIQDSFRQSEISIYEKHRPIFDKYLTLPFLKNPLKEEYAEIKKRLENPKLVSDAILREAKNSSASQVIDSVLTLNKGKVIYMDIWATWCGPCIAEFPKSKKLMNSLSSEDVEFVYICIDSKEELWKPVLDKFELGGQHYFLSSEQSNSLKKAFGVQGIPYYVLMDKNGTITDQGYHLRPENAKGRILALLED